jgi:hypothetical protein
MTASRWSSRHASPTERNSCQSGLRSPRRFERGSMLIRKTEEPGSREAAGLAGRLATSRSPSNLKKTPELRPKPRVRSRAV